jgi:hypothetical protein
MRAGIQKRPPSVFRLADVVRRACAASWRAASWSAGLTKLAGYRRRDTESQCLSRRGPATAHASHTTGVVIFGDASHVGEDPGAEIGKRQPSGAGASPCRSGPVRPLLPPRHAMWTTYAVQCRQCIASCSSATGSQRCYAGTRVAACR